MQVRLDVAVVKPSIANIPPGYRDLSQPISGDVDGAPSEPRKPSAFGAMIDRAQADPEAGRVSFQKYTVYAPRGALPARLPDGSSRSPRVSRVSSAPRGSFGPQGRGGAPPGQLLRRRAPSASNGVSQPQERGRSQRGGGVQQGRGRGGRQGRPQRKRNDVEHDVMDPNTEAEIEEQIYGGPLTPKETLPYKPQQIILDELKADWPNTPLSVSGLVSSVQQQAEVLARRLPHGYVSPDQLAERFEKGELVRFESVEERDKVLAKAAELAKARSDMLTDRKGEHVPARDMSFASIGKDEGTELGSKMGKGVYPELEKQRIPFLDTVMRNLRNNGTYHDSKQDEFMAKIATLLPQQSAKGAQKEKST